VFFSAAGVPRQGRAAAGVHTTTRHLVCRFAVNFIAKDDVAFASLPPGWISAFDGSRKCSSDMHSSTSSCREFDFGPARLSVHTSRVNQSRWRTCDLMPIRKVDLQRNLNLYIRTLYWIDLRLRVGAGRRRRLDHCRTRQPGLMCVFHHSQQLLAGGCRVVRGDFRRLRGGSGRLWAVERSYRVV
jgi:hypothetical protein